MKKVIIVGASSFIGRHLCRYMLNHGYFVYAVVRENCKTLHHLEGLDNIKIVFSNMDRYKELVDLIPNACDVGVLLSWTGTRGADRDNEKMQQNNVFYSKLAAEALAQLGCETIVSAGSQAEYGPNATEHKVNEDFQCHPNTEYGKAKLQFYHWLENFGEENQIRVIEPRFFSLYGEDDFDGTMIISIMKNMLKNQPCDLTECKQIWDFMYIEDAIQALFNIIENPKAEGIFNFGSGESAPLKTYVEKMKKITNSDSVLNYGKISYPETGIVHTNPDVTKLLTYAGCGCQVSFEEGIQRVKKKYEKEN